MVGGYLLSLPERLIRSASAVAGGLLREAGDVVIPGSVRRTRLYRSLVDSTLQFLIEQVGEVKDTYPNSEKLAEDFLARRAAGNGIEMIGILAFRASPVWVMAALADLSGTGKNLIREITTSLQTEGLLEPGAHFETVDQMLDGLETTAGHLAETINTPPLDVEQLRREWTAIRRHAARIPPKDLPSLKMIEEQWAQLQATAVKENRSVFAMSALITMSTIRDLPENALWLSRCAHQAAKKTGELFAGDLLDHYRGALNEIAKEGYLRYWLREFRPYLQAAANHFSPKKSSLTQKLWNR